MKKTILLIVVLLFAVSFYGQVGINTTDPNATLDVEATSVASPTNEDGMLIPRIDDFPSSNPGAAQDGMMVFVTGNGTPSKGFYYWDNGITSWVSVSSAGSNDADWYEENTTSPPTSSTDDIFTDGNVGIGTNNVIYPLQVETSTGSRTVSLFNDNTDSSLYGMRNTIDESATSSNGSTYGIFNSITRTNQTAITGISNSFQNAVSTNSFGYLYGYTNSFGTSTSNTSFGLLNRFQGVATTASGMTNLLGNAITNFYGVDNHDIFGSAMSGNFYGLYNNLTDSGNGARYGVYTDFSETGSGNKYGEYITIATAAGGTHYGVYADVQNASGYAGYFLGRTSLGTATTNRYLMPATDGTSGQVMTTDGAGNVTFQTITGDGDTQNTLDEAYDEGGAGVGRTITADSGAVLIAGEDGLQNTGTFGSGATLALSGAGTRMFFYPRKAAFRAGRVAGTQWNDANVGDYSFAVGQDNTASGSYSNVMGRTNTVSGEYSNALGRTNTASGSYSNALGRSNTASGENAIAVAFGNIASGNASVAIGSSNVANADFAVALGFQNTASGLRSFATGSSNVASGFASSAVGFNNAVSGSSASVFGNANTAPSAYEFVVGTFNTGYTPANANNSNAADRVFTVGNGTGAATRSNALTIYKSGLMNINDAYNMPLTDGTAGQVMTTDGSGNVTFQDASGDDDWTISGTYIDSGTRNVYIGSNGSVNSTMYISGDIVDWDSVNHYLDPSSNSHLSELRVDDGTVTDPAINFYDDNDTGFYRPESGAVGISTNGVDKFRFTPKGQLEFYNTGSSVFLGEGAGNNDDLSGRQNIAVGYRALRDNVSGARNIAIGSGAMLISTGGTANVAIGDDAMAASTSGSSNVSMGTQTLFVNTTGSRNVAVGGTAMRQNSSGNNNTALGYRALYNTTTSSNIAIGFETGFTNASGVNNTFIGTGAGHLTTGSRNVFLGYNAGYNETTSDKLYIDNSNTSSPLIWGDFSSNILRTNGTLQVNNPAVNGYAFPPLDGTSGQVLTTDGAGQLSFTTAAISNTLDRAYDEGGPGVGRTINADNGDVTITGSSGLQINKTATADNTQGLFLDTDIDGNFNASIKNEMWGDGGAGTFRVAYAIDNYIRTEINNGNIYGLRNNFVLGNNAGNSSATGNTGVYNSFYSGSNTGYNIGTYNDFRITSATHYGMRNSNLTTAHGTYYGMYNAFTTTGSGGLHGSYNILSSSGAGSIFGSYSDLNGSGSGNKYGNYIDISSSSGGTHYGIYSDVRSGTGYAGYFIGRTSLGDGTTNRYIMPGADGTVGQVIQTDGSGNLSWANVAGELTTASNGLTEVGDDIQLGGTLTQNTTITNGNFDIEITSTGTATDALTITKTDNSASNNTALEINKTTNGTGSGAGIALTMSGTGSGAVFGYDAAISSTGTATKYAFSNYFSGTGTGTRYGLRNQFFGTGSGTKYAVYNSFGTSSISAKFGLYNDFDSSSGNYYGVNNNMVGATNSAVFGITNTLAGTGTGAKTGISNSFSGANGNVNIYIGTDNTFNDTGNGNRWGTRNNMDGSGTGIHYGTFNDLTGTGSGTKYGSYNYIDSGAGGTHYGVYSEVDNSNGYAGYFLGQNYISLGLGINNPNPDGRLDIIHNSTGFASPHVMLTAQNANSGTRITFDNAVETNNYWVMFARADDTSGSGAFNIYSSEVADNVMRLESDGKMGIMRNPTTNTLEVGGQASKTTAGAFIANSDRRLKKDIETITGETALSKIEKMRGVTYLWDDDKTGSKRPEGLQYGFIAQELMEVFPEKVTKDNLGFYQTAYGDYDPIFVEAIKELKTKNEKLQEKVKSLESQLSKYEELEARLSALEAKDSESNSDKFISEKKK